MPASDAPRSARRSASSFIAAAPTGLSDARSPRHADGNTASVTSAAAASAAIGQRQLGSTAVNTPSARPSGRRKPVPGAPSGASVGNTLRVVYAAATSPAIEKTPSCASPGNPENSSAAKPHTEVARPSRTVGQLSASQRWAPLPRVPGVRASTPAAPPATPACTR